MSILSTMCLILTFVNFLLLLVMSPENLYKHIGSLIKARRKTLGMKQEIFAGKLGISRGSLANIETGRQNVCIHQLYRIADGLQLSPIDFLPLPINDENDVPSEIPMPSGLNAQQRDQISRLFQQVNTKEGNHASKTGRR